MKTPGTGFVGFIGNKEFLGITCLSFISSLLLTKPIL